MTQKTAGQNALHELGYKIFLDRYAQKDMTRTTLAVGDTVIVVVDSKTGQREIGKVTAMALPQVTIELLDGAVVTRDLEHVDKPLETDPGQMMDRVAAGIAKVEPDVERQEEWAKNFRWLLDGWKFVPGGRILTGAGTDQQLTYYNCMPPEQEILTSEGYKPIAEVKLGDLVVTHRNRLRPVLNKFERFTDELLYIINPKKVGYDALRVTGEHKVLVIRSEWLNPPYKQKEDSRLLHEPEWIPASEIRKGDFVAIAFDGEECPPETIFISDYVNGYEVSDGRLSKATVRREHGYIADHGTHFALTNALTLDADLCYLFGRWLGDGCITHRTKTDIPSGIKIVFGLDEEAEALKVKAIIEQNFGIQAALKLSSTKRWYDLWANSMPLGQFFKALLGGYSYGKRIPSSLMHLPNDLTQALLHGLFAADGYISGNKLGIVLSNRTLATQVHQLLLRLGYMFSIKENTHRLGKIPAYRIQATANECGALFKAFFDVDAPDVGIDLKYYFEHEGLRWVRVDSITAEPYCGVVMDIEVQEDHSFVSAGMVVSNCYVIPLAGDSRGGIMKTLSQMTEIMSRGGGVGINLSPLRPRHAYVKGVNGRSSGAVSWGALYSFVTGLIEQGGCFGPDERIATDKGLIPAAELADRMDNGEVFYAHTHKGLRKITARFRNGVKPLYEVSTSRGYRVRITAEHKVAVLRNGEIVTIPLKETSVGSPILLLLNEEVDYALQPAFAEAQNYPNQPKSEAIAVPTTSLDNDTIASITPVGESDVYDFEVEDVHLLSGNGIYTSNSRRGALMLILNDWHPDIFDFINSKRKAGNITNANISVGISDKFMEAVKKDGDWELMFPDTSDPDYDDLWDGDLDTWIAMGRKVHRYKTVKARDVWNAIIESAWASAEPGLWFRERSNKMANSWYFNPLISTNPCVTGDTRIHTNRGLIKAIDLFNDETEIEVVTDGRFGLENTTTPSTRVFMTGRKPVFRLQTQEGYHVRATADHRFMTPRGWVELRDLQPGDKVHILNRKGGFGSEGSLELGRVLGWLVGDGTIKADRAVLSFFGEEKRELAPVFAQYVTQLTETRTLRNRVYNLSVIDVEDRDEARVQSSRLRTIAAEYGLVENKLQVPEVVFRGTEEMQRGFLQALFTADGSVQYASGTLNIRLASSHLKLLEEVQLLLSNFGIASRIYKNRRIGQYRSLPDGKGSYKEYWTEAQHELNISKANTVVFAEEIPFILQRKQDTLNKYLAGYVTAPRSESFVARVEAVIEQEVEEVFDLTEPVTHSFVSNGIINHNCGEQPLGAFSVCNLGAINLSRFYDANSHDVAWDDLQRAVRYSVRFLDDVIDSTPYFFEENAKIQGAERRVGLGTMGVAELMIRLGIRYGSDESVEFIEKLYRFIAIEAYRTSSEIAKEKGSFPAFEAEKLLESGFMQQMPEDIREMIRQNGLRNVTLLTQAPTGTTGTLVNTSTGIEPFFSWVYYRKSRLGLHEERIPVAQEWLEQHPGETKLPDYFATAMDLTPNEHVKVQAAFQRWIDSAISKCVVGDTLILTENGLVDIESLSDLRDVDSFEDLSLNILAPDGVKKTSQFYYGGMRETLRLKLDYGYEIEGTPNHRIHVVQPDGSIDFKFLRDIRVGDKAVLYMGQHIFGASNQELPDQSRPRYKHGRDKKIQLPKHMTKELAYFLGVVTSEGDININGVRITHSSKPLLEKINAIVQSLFGIEGKISADNRRNTVYYLQIHGRKLRHWLLDDLEMFAGASNKIIPPCILRASSDEISAFLKGLFLDAYMVASGRTFGITLASKKLIDQLQILFLNYGILAPKCKTGENAWGLTVAGLNLDRLAMITDFDEVWKNERLQRRKENAIRTNVFGVRLPNEVTQELKQAMKENSKSLDSLFQSGKDTYHTDRIALNAATRMERENAVRIYEHFQDTSSDYLHNFFSQDKNGMVYMAVESIEAGFAEVFDLSVPDGHAFIANGLCNHNTVNCPNEWTVEQVSDLYMYMYDSGCKGGTIYRDGSRDEQVLMLKGDERAESEKKQVDAIKQSKPAEAEKPTQQVATPHRVYPRPGKLVGTTVKCQTPFGTAYITMNSDEHGNPFEVFITAPGKAGSDLQADAEGLGRMISLSLRTTDPHNRTTMLRLIIEQLRDIGGARSVGFGESRVASLPDAVARALEETYFPKDQPQQLKLFGDGNGNGSSHAKPETPVAAPSTALNGTANPNGSLSGADVCPSCANITLIRAEGCRKCLTCGYSEC
jgi:ribonucleotide reductase alpha subunit